MPYLLLSNKQFSSYIHRRMLVFPGHLPPPHRDPCAFRGLGHTRAPALFANTSRAINRPAL